MTSLYPERMYQKYNCYQNTSVYGSAMNSIKGITRPLCEKYCNQISSCTSFEFIPFKISSGNSSCVLRTESLRFNGIALPNNQESCVIDKYRPKSKNYELEKGIGYYGKNLATYKGFFTDCPFVCDRTPECAGFEVVFNNEYNDENDVPDLTITCNFKASTNKKHVQSNTWGYYFDSDDQVSLNNDTKREYIVIDGVTLTGTVIRTLSSRDPEVCRKECDLNVEGCQSFAWINGTS